MRYCQFLSVGPSTRSASAARAFYALRFVTQLTTRIQMSLFSAVEMAPRDPILGLTEAFNADTRPPRSTWALACTITDEGKIPLLRAVQEAEKQLAWPAPRRVATCRSKACAAYDQAVQTLVFGKESAADHREARCDRAQALVAPAP